MTHDDHDTDRPRVAGAGRCPARSRPLFALLLAGGAEADDPPPIQAERLTSETHNTFTDDVAVQVRDRADGRPADVVNLRDASNMAVFQFTIQPGAWFA